MSATGSTCPARFGAAVSFYAPPSLLCSHQGDALGGAPRVPWLPWSSPFVRRRSSIRGGIPAGEPAQASEVAVSVTAGTGMRAGSARRTQPGYGDAIRAVASATQRTIQDQGFLRARRAAQRREHSLMNFFSPAASSGTKRTATGSTTRPGTR